MKFYKNFLFAIPIISLFIGSNIIAYDSVTAFRGGGGGGARGGGEFHGNEFRGDQFRGNEERNVYQLERDEALRRDNLLEEDEGQVYVPEDDESQDDSQNQNQGTQNDPFFFQ